MKSLTKLCAVTVAVLVLAALTSCGKSAAPLPTITIINQNTNSNNGGGTGGGTTPGAGQGGGAIGSVKVVQFGETCPAGTSPSGVDRSVRVKCTKNLTCTPFLTNGEKALPIDHGPSPDFFGAVAGAGGCTVSHPSEPFNLDVTGTAPGTCTFSCIAKGVRSADFDLTVVQ